MRSSLSYLLWYVPVALVLVAVLEICKHEDPKIIVVRTARAFLSMTLVLGIGSALLYVFHRYF